MRILSFYTTKTFKLRIQNFVDSEWIGGRYNGIKW